LVQLVVSQTQTLVSLPRTAMCGVTVRFADYTEK
jgi:hypothetical protein